MRREFKIMKVNYNPTKGDLIHEKHLISNNSSKKIYLEVACEFSKSFKNLTKEIQCAKLIKYGNYIALLYDTSTLVIIKE